MLSEEAIRAMAEEISPPVYRRVWNHEVYMSAEDALADRAAHVAHVHDILRRHLQAANPSQSPPKRDTSAERVPADDRLTRAVGLLDRCLSVIQYPDNGYHHCRRCRAGSHNQWQHDEGCSYKHQTDKVDDIRNDARAFLAELGDAT